MIEIAAKLWTEGLFVTEVDPVPAQSFVDLQWAARQAGRVLGGRAILSTRGSADPHDSRLTLSVTYVDPSGRDIERAEEGLEALMRTVLENRPNR